MTLPRDRERVRQIISDTIGLLCRNGLSFDTELSVDALIGITIDRQEVLLVSIKDTYNSENNCLQVDESGTSSLQTLCSLKENRSSDSCSTSNSACKQRSSCMDATNPKVVEDNVKINNKQTDATNLVLPTANRKRLTQKHECLDEFSKRTRILEDTDVPNRNTKAVVIKSEPNYDLSEVNVSDTRPLVNSVASDLRTEHCHSGLTSEVCGEANFVTDSAELEEARLCDEDLSSVSIVVEERHRRSPSSIQASNFSLRNGSRLSLSDCAVRSNVDKCISPSPANSPSDNCVTKIKKTCYDLSNNGTDNSSPVPNCNSQMTNDSHVINFHPRKHTISENSNFLVSGNKSSVSRSCKAMKQRSGQMADSLQLETSNLDSDVICIKVEAPDMTLNSSASLQVDPSAFSCDNVTSLHEAICATSSLENLNLETLPYDQFSAWKDSPNVCFHAGRRPRQDPMYFWNHDSTAPPFEDAVLIEKQLKLAIQAILLYDGQYVPLRDIQRLRLCGMAAGQIKVAMERLSSYGGKLGCFQVLHGGVNLFYKCPPTVIDKKTLESLFGIPWETYKFHYDVLPAANITTRHNEQYWLKVASSSPYITTNIV